jgi:hypothetical protein
MESVRDTQILILAKLSSVATEQSRKNPPQAATSGHPRVAQSVLRLIQKA